MVSVVLPQEENVCVVEVVLLEVRGGHLLCEAYNISKSASKLFHVLYIKLGPDAI